MSIRGLLLAASLLATAGVQAQALPKPVEFYFEADALAVKPIVAVRETGEAGTQKLLRAIQRNPRAVAERAQLAHIAMEAGRVELGQELYADTLARITVSDSLYRPVLWNYGWDLYRAGDAEGALKQWQVLLSARNSTASWIPPTLAMALWSLGRKDEAVQWYAAAVRTEPEQWRTSARHAVLLPEWKESERATLAEVQAAWAANPPTWP
ncbi:tetratricopeptide repeat protein [Lysobacter olei]